GRERTQSRLAVETGPATLAREGRTHCAAGTRGGARTQCGAPAGTAGGRRTLRIEDRTMVGVSDGQARGPAGAALGSAPVRGGAGARARPRAARVVQSVPREGTVGKRAARVDAHRAASSRTREEVRHAALDGSGRAGGARADAARGARRGEALRHRWRASRRLLLSVSR